MAMPVEIAEVTLADLDDWVALAMRLWPAEHVEFAQAQREMRAELESILHSPRDTGLLGRDRTGKTIAFINLSLCYEYVPGASRFPVAYVEGIYVDDKARQDGIGAALIKRAEAWAIANGCIQLASDVLIENEASSRFHTQVGFREVERVICFIKDIEPDIEAEDLKTKDLKTNVLKLL